VHVQSTLAHFLLFVSCGSILNSIVSISNESSIAFYSFMYIFGDFMHLSQAIPVDSDF
jgi:hypothetical protein